jgi:hypothetical protein
VHELVIYGGASRADLVDQNTGEVWEIKSGAGVGAAARTVLAATQARRYIGGKGKRGNKSITITQLGSKNAFQGSFTINCLDRTYLVTYETPAAGVILYFVSETKYQTNADYFYQPVYLEDYQMNLSSNIILCISPSHDYQGKNVFGSSMLVCGAGLVVSCFIGQNRKGLW